MLLESDNLDAAKPYMPSSTLRLMKREREHGRKAVDWRDFETTLLHAIVTKSADELGCMHEMTEGLEHRLLNLLPQLPDLCFESLLAALKTKRYTRTKLQRAMLALLLGHSKAELSPASLAKGPGYIRVLGFTPTGQTLLKRMRHAAQWPVINSAARAPKAASFLALDIRATSVYALGRNPQAAPRDLLRDYYETPLRVGF